MKQIRYHFLALLVVTIWGTAFVSTKILLDNGLSPRDILFFRFLLAYICILLFSFRQKLFADNWKDELKLAAMGIAGCSLYFLLANTALDMTQSSNVALLTCTSPIFIVLISWIFLKNSEKTNRYFWHGSILALAGIALVVFNGATALQINPVGDGLSLLAALSWAVYTIFVRRMSERYSALFITRKVFFYGVLTVIPLFLITPLNYEPEYSLLETLSKPVVWSNLLYLGIISSLMCFFLWSVVVKNMGTVNAANYLYASPAVTMLAGVFVLNERITLVAIIGALFILSGVALTEWRK